MLFSLAVHELWYEKLRIKWWNFSAYNKSKLELQTYGLRHTRNFLYHVLAFRALFNQMRTADVKFLQLCNEIDQWKEEANYWKEKYEELQKEYSEHINQNLVSAQKGVANALMFALSVKDDENGNLIIDKESRKELAETWRS